MSFAQKDRFEFHVKLDKDLATFNSAAYTSVGFDLSLRFPLAAMSHAKLGNWEKAQQLFDQARSAPLHLLQLGLPDIQVRKEIDDWRTEARQSYPTIQRFGFAYYMNLGG